MTPYTPTRDPRKNASAEPVQERFTDAFVRKLAGRPGTRYEVRERSSPLRIRVGETGHKSFCVTRHSPVTGKTERLTIGSTERFTVSQARAEAMRLAADMAARRDVAGERRSVRADAARRGASLESLLAIYVRDKLVDDRPLAPATVANYRRRLTSLFGSLDIPVDALTPDFVHECFVRHAQPRIVPGRNGGKIKRGSASGARHAVVALRAVLRYHKLKGQAEEITELLVDRGLRLRKKEVRQARIPLDKAQALAAWISATHAAGPENAAKPTAALMFLMACLTGLRLRTLIELRWSWLDLDNGRMNIPANAMKLRRSEVLPIPPKLAALLKNRQADALSEFVFDATGIAGRHRLLAQRFFSCSPMDMSAHDARKLFAQVLRTVGCERFGVMLLMCHSTEDDILQQHYAQEVAMKYAPDVARAEAWLMAESENSDKVAEMNILAAQRASSYQARARVARGGYIQRQADRAKKSKAA